MVYSYINMSNHFSGGDLKTAAKLVILEEYLDVYTTILDSNWEWAVYGMLTHTLAQENAH